MFIKSLDELLARDNLIGFQNGMDLPVAKKLAGCLGTEKVHRRWMQGISMVNPKEFKEWEALVDEGNPIFILVTNLTRDVGDLTVDSIKPAILPDADHHSKPMIVFNVS